MDTRWFTIKVNFKKLKNIKKVLRWMNGQITSALNEKTDYQTLNDKN